MTVAAFETPETWDMRDYWTRNSLPPVGPEETARLVASYRNDHDDQALDTLVRANVRFVIDVASEYPSRQRDFEDIVADGITGLIEAIDRFDPERGARLISYAVHWIRQAIMSGLANNVRTVRCPENVHANAVKVRRAIAIHMARHNAKPTHEQIAEHTGLGPDDVERAMLCNTPEFSLNSGVRSYASGPGSHDQEVSYLDLLRDGGPSQHDQVEQADLVAFVWRLLEGLPARQQRILKARFGLDGGEPQYLEAIGHQMGLTRERVRQLQEDALKRLKAQWTVVWATGYAPPSPEDEQEDE